MPNKSWFHGRFKDCDQFTTLLSLRLFCLRLQDHCQLLSPCKGLQYCKNVTRNWYKGPRKEIPSSRAWKSKSEHFQSSLELPLWLQEQSLGHCVLGLVLDARSLDRSFGSDCLGGGQIPGGSTLEMVTHIWFKVPCLTALISFLTGLLVLMSPSSR